MKHSPAPFEIEICILAGGASSRMGRDKASLRLGQRTMLGIIREQAKKIPGAKVRVIRRDLVEQCGPLGGIYTGLKTTRANAVLFLACDMPLVTGAFLQKLLSRFTNEAKALFVQSESAGFPFLLRRTVLPAVEEQIAGHQFSIHRLCVRLKGELFVPSDSEANQLFNVNTAEELAIVRKKLRTPAKLQK